MAKIFYFTGTGNCYSVARQLGKKMEAELVPITKYLDNPSEIKDAVIGIVTPVYSTDLPTIVVDFLKKLQISNVEYIFCVATMGAIAGRTLYHVKEILHNRGVVLNAGFTVMLPDNSIIFPSGRLRMHKLLETETLAVNTIGDAIVKLEENSAGFKDFFLWRIAAAVGMWAMYVIFDVNNKKVDQRKCNGCGICAQVCPVGCIQMENGYPSFKEGCVTCFACAQWCPREAITLGRLHPAGKTKYVHPGVTVSDVAWRGVSQTKLEKQTNEG